MSVTQGSVTVDTQDSRDITPAGERIAASPNLDAWEVVSLSAGAENSSDSGIWTLQASDHRFDQALMRQWSAYHDAIRLTTTDVWTVEMLSSPVLGERYRYTFTDESDLPSTRYHYERHQAAMWPTLRALVLACSKRDECALSVGRFIPGVDQRAIELLAMDDGVVLPDESGLGWTTPAQELLGQ